MAWAALWLSLFASLTVLVHLRVLTAVDEPVMQLVAKARPAVLTEAMNWVFRLGYVQIDAALALVWAGVLLVGRRSLVAALPPLVLFAAIGVQVGVRMITDQPPPRAYELARTAASQPIGYTLDRADTVVRETLRATTGSESGVQPAAYVPERASYPSGHASRALFLALLAMTSICRLPSILSRLAGGTLALLALLVGYSALYYGYHWPSDLIGGYLLGLAFFQIAAWVHGAPRLTASGSIRQDTGAGERVPLWPAAGQ